MLRETSGLNCSGHYSFDYVSIKVSAIIIQILCPLEFIICLVFLFLGWETSMVAYFPSHDTHILKCRSMQRVGKYIFRVALSAQNCAHLFVNSPNIYWVSTKCWGDDTDPDRNSPHRLHEIYSPSEKIDTNLITSHVRSLMKEERKAWYDLLSSLGESDR